MSVSQTTVDLFARLGGRSADSQARNPLPSLEQELAFEKVLALQSDNKTRQADRVEARPQADKPSTKPEPKNQETNPSKAEAKSESKASSKEDRDEVSASDKKTVNDNEQAAEQTKDAEKGEESVAADTDSDAEQEREGEEEGENELGSEDGQQETVGEEGAVPEEPEETADATTDVAADVGLTVAANVDSEAKVAVDSPLGKTTSAEGDAALSVSANGTDKAAGAGAVPQEATAARDTSARSAASTEASSQGTALPEGLGTRENVLPGQAAATAQVAVEAANAGPSLAGAGLVRASANEDNIGKSGARKLDAAPLSAVDSLTAAKETQNPSAVATSSISKPQAGSGLAEGLTPAVAENAATGQAKELAPGPINELRASQLEGAADNKAQGDARLLPSAGRQAQGLALSSNGGNGVDVSALASGAKEGASTSSSTSIDGPRVAVSSMSQFQSIAAKGASVQTQVQTPVGQPQWGNAVASKVLWMAAQNLTSAEIHLDPPELGPMMVRVTVSQEQASVSFASHSVAVREALDQNAFRLREQFDDQGMDLVHVDVGEQALQQQAENGDEGDGSGNGSQAGEESESEVSLPMASSAGLVDYFV